MSILGPRAYGFNIGSSQLAQRIQKARTQPSRQHSCHVRRLSPLHPCSSPNIAQTLAEVSEGLGASRGGLENSGLNSGCIPFKFEGEDLAYACSMTCQAPAAGWPNLRSASPMLPHRESVWRIQAENGIPSQKYSTTRTNAIISNSISNKAASPTAVAAAPAPVPQQQPWSTGSTVNLLQKRPSKFKEAVSHPFMESFEPHVTKHGG